MASSVDDADPIGFVPYSRSAPAPRTAAPSIPSEEVVSGRDRRSYGLTDAGSAALQAEATRMTEAARVVTRARPAASQGRGAGPAGRKVRPA